MVHYILRFITTKHVSYGSIIIIIIQDLYSAMKSEDTEALEVQLRGLGEHCKLPQYDLGQSPSGN